MEALALNIIIMFACVGLPVMILQMPILVNEDGTLNKWHWPVKLSLAALVAVACFYSAPLAMQWFK